jgi:hypothetical protein
MSHTPGPWKIACESGDWFATLNDYAPIPATEANARLIAAAPDLLEALRDVIGWVPGGAAEMWHTDAPTKAVERARAAIAKAEGK